MKNKEVYQADITYGIGTEFGFDYLRDHMILDEELKVQRPYHFAIIDEVDSILIDEAKTPLIIANKASLYSKLFSVCSKVVRRMENDVDYTIDLEARTAFLQRKALIKLKKPFPSIIYTT